MQITITGELCDLNTYIEAERKNRFLASKIKKEETERVWSQVFGKRLPSATKYPITIEAVWYSINLKKDQDNITFAKKFILDGLKMAKVIPDDSRKYVRVWTDIDVKVDKLRPRVEITIKSNE